MKFNFDPFGQTGKTLALILLVLALFVVPLALNKCHAADLDLSLGSAYVRGPTAAIQANYIQPKVIAGIADLSIGATIIGSSTWRGYGIYEQPTNFNNNQAIVQAQVITHLKKLEIGVGLAYLQHEDNYNCKPIDFSLSFQHPIWRNMFGRMQHYSSGGTCFPNYGRDLLFLGWRF